MDENDILLYEECFSEEAMKKDSGSGRKWFVQGFYRNPCSHETDWFIEGVDGRDAMGEETAMLFDSPEEALTYMHARYPDMDDVRYEVHRSSYS